MNFATIHNEWKLFLNLLLYRSFFTPEFAWDLLKYSAGPDINKISTSTPPTDYIFFSNFHLLDISLEIVSKRARHETFYHIPIFVVLDRILQSQSRKKYKFLTFTMISSTCTMETRLNLVMVSMGQLKNSENILVKLERIFLSHLLKVWLFQKASFIVNEKLSMGS